MSRFQLMSTGFRKYTGFLLKIQLLIRHNLEPDSFLNGIKVPILHTSHTPLHFGLKQSGYKSWLRVENTFSIAKLD